MPMPEPRCEVCGSTPIVGVGASALGPGSFAYCDDCLCNGFEPRCAIVAYVYCMSGDVDEAFWVQCARQGITRGDVLGEVARIDAEMDAEMDAAESDPLVDLE